jgi:hypothetical protein
MIEEGEHPTQHTTFIVPLRANLLLSKVTAVVSMVRSAAGKKLRLLENREVRLLENGEKRILE